MTTLEQEIIIQRDTGIRSAPEMYAVQLEDIADQIEAQGHHDTAETLREDAHTLRHTDNLSEEFSAWEAYEVASDWLTEFTGLHAVTIPENGAWFIVTQKGLELLDEEEN